MTHLQPESISFSQLVDSIHSIHESLAARASRAVNVSLTTRNWLIGCYIQEFEQGGRIGPNTASNCWSVYPFNSRSEASAAPKSANCVGIASFIRPIPRFGTH